MSGRNWGLKTPEVQDEKSSSFFGVRLILIVGVIIIVGAYLLSGGICCVLP